jgi:cytoskeletal protein RodZ
MSCQQKKKKKKKKVISFFFLSNDFKKKKKNKKLFLATLLLVYELVFLIALLWVEVFWYFGVVFLNSLSHFFFSPVFMVFLK